MVPRRSKLTHIARLVSTTLVLLALPLAAATGCGSDGDGRDRTLYIGGIPDQDTSLLVRRFGDLADYLAQRLGVDVEYIPTIDYAAVVTGFKSGDIHLGWYGGLTGVQARKAVPGAVAIAQRPRDERFLSVFIVGSKVDAESLGDLKGLTFTFGSESSTSGHLMPRHFLVRAGIDADRDFRGLPNFSGSHDKTWKLVESGAYQAGALSEAVWSKAVEQGRADLTKVRLLQTTEPYHDYNWTARPDLDATFGEGFTGRLREALLSMAGDPEQQGLLEAFQTDSFIATTNENYRAIEDVARRLGIIE
jgi:phosphonate transport system substrate-binding protein